MDLLDELWSLIFGEYLDFLDTVRCREVSRRFKFLIDQLRPRELLIHGDNPHRPLSFAWPDRDPEMWIQLSSLKLKPDSSFYSLFANLKFLQLNVKLQTDFNIETLNVFTRLEQLYVNMLYIDKSQTLKLPALKVLSLRFKLSKERRRYSRRFKQIDYDREPHLTIDCRVETLLGARSKLLWLTHPECVHHLETDIWPRFIASSEQFLRFPNVRSLHTELCKALPQALPALKHLQELHIDVNPYQDRITERQADQTFYQLLNKRLELKLDVKIYLRGLEVLKEKPLIQAWVCRNKFMEEKIENYHKLPNRMKRVLGVNYTELVDLLDHFTVQLARNGIVMERGFPVDFFNKFSNITFVTLSRIDDEKRFLWFLSRCIRLVQVNFGLTRLSQSALNQLPAACKSLKVLTVLSFSEKAGRDLTWIYKLKQLFALRIHTDDAGLISSFDSRVLLQQNRYLVSIRLNDIAIFSIKKRCSLPGRSAERKRLPIILAKCTS